MNPFKVYILGCGSAMPSKVHNPSSQIIEIRGKYFMVDCGEGTQGQIRRFHINFSKLYAIFISHIHGDHIFGLLGMLSTFGLQGRTAPLHVYAPAHYEELFLMEKKIFGWVVLSLGIIIVLLSVMMTTHLHWIRSSAFTFIVMFGMTAAGGAMVLKEVFRKD
jgi:ribonuclease BN (tRNA processing enzyme)